MVFVRSKIMRPLRQKTGGGANVSTSTSRPVLRAGSCPDLEKIECLAEADTQLVGNRLRAEQQIGG